MNNYENVNMIYSEAEFYNSEFKNYDDDFTFWKYWIKKLNPQSVLEIGIGNGRLTKLLSPEVKHYDVIELSKNLIDAYNKENKLSNGTIYNQDMKKIEIDDKYDLIIMAFNTFSYLYTAEDIRNFFEGVKNIMTEDAILVIDIFNPKDGDMKDVDNYRYIMSFEVGDSTCQLYEKHFYDKITKTIMYYKKYKIGDMQKELILPNKVYFADEIDAIIENNEFDILSKFGDYNNEEYTRNSRKQILFIRRKVNESI